ncbi:MAG TPA: hypothetical protein VG738_16310 [Chitinophagaceae bacterium]|nr:hypothetical protein [Chitinophagaceae bacterium]
MPKLKGTIYAIVKVMSPQEENDDAGGGGFNRKYISSYVLFWWLNALFIWPGKGAKIYE